MNIGKNIKHLREQNGMTQQQIADLINMHRSNYSKVESGQRELSVGALCKIAQYFGVSLDDLVSGNGEMPEEVTVEDKTLMEQVRLIQELEPEDQSMVFRMIDTLLTKKKFKEFFEQQLAS